MADIQFDFSGRLDQQSINKIVSQLGEAKKRLEREIRMSGDDLIDEKDALRQINKVTKALEYSFNSSIDRLDTN